MSKKPKKQNKDLKLEISQFEYEINSMLMEIFEFTHDDEGFLYEDDTKLFIDFNLVKMVEEGKTYDVKEYKLFRPLYIKLINDFCIDKFLEINHDLNFNIKKIGDLYEVKILDVDDNVFVTTYSQNEKFGIIKSILMFYYGKNVIM